MNRDERLESIIYFLMDRTYRRARQYTHLVFEQEGFDITLDQWVVLKSVSENPGITQRDIAERVFKDRPTVTRILDLLEKKGFLKRRIGESDRRTFEIRLTKAGEKLVEEMIHTVVDIRRQGLKGIDEQDLETAKSVLIRIFENFS